jgi:hypothetical protein
MNGWTWAWIVWILVFAVVEIPAIIRKNRAGDDSDRDTLSDHLVSWFHIKTTAGKIAWSVFALGGGLWLWLHILTEQAV